MAFEVDEEPLPAGWEVLMSRSKNMPYYSNVRSKKVYWVDDELPRGWSHQFDDKGRLFYFHIRNKNDTITYDKPVLRPLPARDDRQQQQLPPSPDPLPVPEPSYDRRHDHDDHDRRRYSEDSSHSTPRGGGGGSDHHASASSPWRAADPPPPVRMERKKSNSLMDLLSPGPPALGADERSPDVDNSPGPSPSARQQRTSSSTMDIANLVTSSSSSSSFSPAASASVNPSFAGAKRSFEQISKEADPDAAADFYNKLQRNKTSDRADSMLFHMRAMNNWVKSILIGDFSKRGDRVLDLACGKGGDLMKWAKRGFSKYVGVDIAQKSLEDAVDRFSNNAQNRELDVAFVQGDLGKVSLTDDVLHCWSRDVPTWNDRATNIEPGFFNIVSMQFAFHYMFGDEPRANRFFQTLHTLLADGGVFIATTVDPNKILMKYYQSLGPASNNGDEGSVTANGDVRILDEKKHEVCTIRFDETIRHHLLGHNASREGLFGLRYNFTLRDSNSEEGGEAVDTPEYLVPDDLLNRLLKENGFELLLKQNFHQFILKNTDKNRSLLEKMKVMNYDGSISDAEWEIAGLYQVLAFKKAY